MTSRDSHSPVDASLFNQNCGVGVTPTDKDLDERINLLFETHRVDIAEQRYRYILPLLRLAKNDDMMRWANALTIKELVEKRLEAVCGPKDERDTQPVKKTKEKGITCSLNYARLYTHGYDK